MSHRQLLTTSGFAFLSVCSAFAGTVNQVNFTGDIDSGISTALTYTAKADIAGTGSIAVNGVAFANTGLSGTNYTLTGPANVFTGNTNNVTGQVGAMAQNFNYGDASGIATLTLSGLTIGQRYVTTWYNVGFGGAGTRNVAITPSDTGVPFTVDENASGDKNGNLIRYVFTATAASITYSMDAVSNPDTFHHYAFSNHVLTSAPPVISSSTGAGPGFSPYTPSNTDLLQTSLSGSATSSGNFAMDGSGGVPILNNGLAVINGGNPGDNSQLATGNNNAVVSYTLNTSLNALGYDVSSIDIYGGWNDSGRDRALVNLSYSVVGSAEWIPFGFLDFNPAAGGAPSAYRAVFPASLTGVDAIRFDFPNAQENGYAGYSEFDVIGAATIPEPSVAVLTLLAGLGFAAVRRRR